MGALSSKQQQSSGLDLPQWFEPHQGLQLPNLRVAPLCAPPQRTTACVPVPTPFDLALDPSTNNAAEVADLEERQASFQPAAASGVGEAPTITAISGDPSEASSVVSISSASSLNPLSSLSSAGAASAAPTTNVVTSFPPATVSITSTVPTTSPSGPGTTGPGPSPGGGGGGGGGSRLAAGAIAGIVIAVVLYLLGVVLATCLYRRRRRKARVTNGSGDIPQSASDRDLPEVAEPADINPTAHIAELPQQHNQLLPPELPGNPAVNVSKARQLRNSGYPEQSIHPSSSEPIYEAPAAPRSPLLPPVAVRPLAGATASVPRKPLSTGSRPTPALNPSFVPDTDGSNAPEVVQAPQEVVTGLEAEDSEIARLREENAKLEERRSRLLQLQRLDEEQARVQRRLDDRIEALSRK